MGPQGWAILLTVLMTAAVFLELLTGTIGAFTLVALVSMGFSIVKGFQVSTEFGYAMVAVNVTLFPIAMFFTIKLLRYSPARLNAEIRSNPDSPLEEDREDSPLEGLVGCEGVAMTDLRPSGKAVINDERYDVTANGNYVDKDSKIKVLKAEGNRLVVEPVVD